MFNFLTRFSSILQPPLHFREREYLKIIFGIIFPKKIKLYIDEVVDLSPFISSYGTLVTMEVFDLNIRNTIENGNT